MKRDSSWMTNNKGFTFPIVLLIITIIFIMLFSNINFYEQEIEMTKQHSEQLYIETLVQITREKLKQDLKVNPELKNTLYILPNGNVHCDIYAVASNQFQIELKITTRNNSEFTSIGLLHINR